MSKSDKSKVDVLLSTLREASKHYPQYAVYPAAIVKINQQALFLLNQHELVAEYPVSTSRYGTGQEEGTYRTPLGVHIVQEKLGENIQTCEIFESRVPSGNLATIEHATMTTGRDCITSRILWLSGIEPGKNQGIDANGKCVDSYKRYIYIHGTHEEGMIGKPASMGCIRMKNEDVIDVFSHLEISSLVIVEP